MEYLQVVFLFDTYRIHTHEKTAVHAEQQMKNITVRKKPLMELIVLIKR